MSKRAVNLLIKRAQNIITPTITGGNLAVTAGTLDVQDGGTVTQATSKATGVTLSTNSGQITMNNAALADDAVVTFVVTNTLVAATDVIIANLADGATSNSYHLDVGAVGAGGYDLQLRNISGGSLSEAVVINVALIKGASS